MNRLLTHTPRCWKSSRVVVQLVMISDEGVGMRDR